MTLIDQETYICLDLETTGLDPVKDKIIEVAVICFNSSSILASMESLIQPCISIPEETIAIHHITNDMVSGKPTIDQVLPALLQMINDHIIIGHGIGMDIAFLIQACKQNNIPNTLSRNSSIDTLRLARLYGQSPTNSLEVLREHFNIKAEGAHRAMNDVIVNIEVFKQLAKQFKTTQQLFDRLDKPILLKKMPLGKHKGRPFSEIPIEYLRWAAHQEFDQDLLFSLRTELSLRKRGTRFSESSNPFSAL